MASNRLIIGISIGVFVCILASLLSVSLMLYSNDASAQSILVSDSNTSVSTISYQLNLNDLNISIGDISRNNISGNASGNISSVSYDCILNVSGNSYEKSGVFSSNNSLIVLNQSLNNVLPDGYYVASLRCVYAVISANDSLHPSYNITITNLKSILLDSTPPIITYSGANNITINITSNSILYNSNSSGNNSNNSSILSLDLSMNFTASDLSSMNCLINISGSLLNFSSNSSNNSFNSNNTLNISIPLHMNIDLSSLYYSYMVPYSVSCVDVIGNRNVLNSSMIIFVYAPNSSIANSSNASLNTSGNYTNNSCNGTMNNTNSNCTNNTNISIDPFFNISVSNSAFNLGEIGYYTINALNGSNVSITICPVASGWVQCFVALPFINESFPKVQALPYTNKTGSYRIDGIMKYKNISITKNATYETANTLTASITASKTSAGVGDTITYNATASSGIGSYTYRWVMDNGAVFNGQGAYKSYSSSGTFRTTLFVNDSAGNNFTTYIDVNIRNYYTLSVIVLDQKDSSRISGVTVKINNNGDIMSSTDSNGVASFKLLSGSYGVYASKDNYGGYVSNVDMSSDQTLYMNMSFIDLTPPAISLLTSDDPIFTKDSVDLKFKAVDTNVMACSLYIAGINDSWYTVKDSGDNLASDTEYTFEIRDLNNGAYKWKIGCSDSDQNKAYSIEQKFVVSDGSVTAALQSGSEDSDNLNTALDNLDKLSGDESDVVSILGIKSGLEDLLDRINRLDKDVHDLSYRRDLNDTGKLEAQNNLTGTIDYLKNNTPIGLTILDSKTFVKYAHDDDLKSIVDSYLAAKNLNLDAKAFSESTKSIQSRVIISTHVRTVELYYADGRTRDITLVTHDIQSVKPEDDMTISNSNTITFIESIPKSISQSAKLVNMITKEYTILKDDPLIEYPANTRRIVYYFDGKISLDTFENVDTLIIDKSVDAVKSSTGLSILGISSISDITNITLDGQSMMIIAVIVLILFYVVFNFDIIEKVRNLITGAGTKKKVSFIRVLVNDALDYLQTGDYDKASLIYREIKLSYEEANDAVKRQVYDESFDLCNKLDVSYALTLLDNVEYHIRMNDKNKAISEIKKLDNTYNKIDAKYRSQMSERFQRVLSNMKN